MRPPRSRSSSGVRRGSFAISRRYAASVLASLGVMAYRRDTRRAYTRFVRVKPDTTNFVTKILLRGFLASGFVVRRRGRGRRADEVGRRRLDERGREPLLPVVDTTRELTLDVFHELVDFVLHLLDLAAHVEHDLDAGQIDAQISGK